uniref:Uncharacterized protein n=1 Tax=Aegilops tauschii TaxID=37682 RepID=N1QZG7_AEGTA
MGGEGVPAPAISAVLHDDDLLGEILIHAAFPTSLVRTALPLSDLRAWFLHQNYRQHPTSVPGFYIKTTVNTPRFVSFPTPAR